MLAVGAGGGCLDIFFSHLSILFSFSLSLGDGPIWTEILSQRAVKPKTTNQPSQRWGWSGGAMVLGKLPISGHPAYLDKSRARTFCACSRCGWELFGHFFSLLSFLFLSPSLLETTQYRLKYCLKGPFSPKQPTNQPSQRFERTFGHG